eukprot:gene6779-7305_t
MKSIYYASSYGKLPEFAKKPFGTPNFHFSDVSFLELKVGTAAIDTAQMHSITANLSSLLGGTFHNTYDFLKPISLDYYTLARIFPRERLNGESIDKWIDSFPSFQSLSQNLTKELFHSSPWYSIQLQSTEKLTTEDRQLYNNELIIRILINLASSSIHRSLLPAINHLNSSISVKRVTDLEESPIIVKRKAFNTRHREFYVTTKVSLSPFANQPFNLSLLEAIPVQYTMFRQSLLVVRTKENQECASAMSISINATLESCDTENQVSFHSSSKLYDSSVQVRFQIYPGESVELSWTGKKNLLTMQHYPPDTSYGFHVLPAIIRYKNFEKDLFETEYLTESVVLNRPIPDLSMPYNVITLVSAVMAFLIGSILNAWIRKHSHRRKANS